MKPTEMQSSRWLPSVVLTTKPSVRFETLWFHLESPGWMFAMALPGDFAHRAWRAACSLTRAANT